MLRFSNLDLLDNFSAKHLAEAALTAQDFLTTFAVSEDFAAKLVLASGDSFDTERLEDLRQKWIDGDFESLPAIEILSASEINNANGAFAAATNTIYLSREYIAQNTSNTQAIVDVLLEEIGHFVDAQINALDTPGDEGAVFAALVQSTELDKSSLQALKGKNDTTTIVLEGQTLEIEQANSLRPILIIPGIVGTAGKDYESWLINRSPRPTDLQIDPLLRVYDDLIQTLKNVGYKVGENLFVANYDWRLNPGPIDGKVDGRIDGITTKSITDNVYEYGVDYLGYWLNQARAKGATEVDIIGHSTGGLVTRTYLQSDAYGRDRLPKVNNFFMLGVPNRGASKAWNILQDDFSADPAFRLVLSDILDDAYQHVIDGGTIVGPKGEKITAADIAGEEGKKKFISAYVPSVRSLLATYDFIEINRGRSGINQGLKFDTPDSDPSSVQTIDVSERNSLVLDLNNGLDLLFSPFDVKSGRDPSLFAKQVSGQVFNIFGFDQETPTTVKPFVGNQFGFSDGIFSFTRRGALGRSPRPGELWYQDNATKGSEPFQKKEEPDDLFKGGDETVPLVSSIGQFYDAIGNLVVEDQRVKLQPFSGVSHTGMVSDQSVQKYILDRLGVSYQDNKISTDLSLARSDNVFEKLANKAASIKNAVKLGILDAEDLAVGSIFTLLNLFNPADYANEVLAGLEKLFSTSPETESFLTLSNATQDFSALSKSRGLIEEIFSASLPLLGDTLQNSDAIQFIDKIKASVTSELDTQLSSLVLKPIQNLIESALEGALGQEIPEAISGQIVNRLQQAIVDTSGATPEVIEPVFKQALAEALGPSGLGVLIDKNNDGQIDSQDITEELLTDFYIQLRVQVEEQINNLVTDPGDLIRLALANALGPNGLDILPDLNSDGEVNGADIKFVEDENNLIFDLNLSHKETFDTSLASDLGLPSLGLKLDGNAKVDFGYNFDFGFGINKTDGFFFDTSNDGKAELTLTLDATTPGLAAQGKLGFLQLDVNDKNTQFNSKFNVDLKDPDNDGRLTSAELPSFDFDRDVDTKLTGLADVNLNLATSFDGSAVLPKISSDFNLDWDFGSEENPTDVNPGQPLGNTPAVAFNNVQLDLGTFFNNFADPVLENVRRITEPIQPIIDVLTTPINLRIARFNLLDIAQAAGFIDQQDRDLIDSVAQLTSIINAIPGGSELPPIKLGSFNLGDADVRAPGFDLSGVNPNLTEPAPPVAEQLPADSQEANFVSSFNSIPGGGLEFPILTDPTTAFNLLLGKDANLFTYDTPRLDFNASYGQFFRIFGPLGARIQGEFGAAIDLAFGYDTAGLRQFSDTGNSTDIFNGFFVSDRANPDGTGGDVSEVILNAGLKAFAELNVAVASAGVGGGILGNIGFDLKDPNNDGKVRVDEFAPLLNNPLNLFNTSGRLAAGLSAFLRVGFTAFGRFIGYSETFNSPTVKLLSFGGSDPLASKLDGNMGNVDVSILLLHMGPQASARLEGNITDGDERFIVEHKSGSARNENISVSAFGVTEEYTGISTIVADGGKGNDTIKLKADIVTPADLAGGNDNDTLYGGGSDDLLDGGSGNDKLFGRNGDDLLIGGPGADILEGGEGNDIASYITAATEVSASLAKAEGLAGDAKGDKFQLIENLVGSGFNDTLTGDCKGNILIGEAGNDKLIGGAGNDTLDGGRDADSFIYDTTQGFFDKDTILNFEKNADLIRLESCGIASINDLNISTIGGDTVIDLSNTFARPSGSDTITLVDVTGLTNSNFAFIS